MSMSASIYTHAHICYLLHTYAYVYACLVVYMYTLGLLQGLRVPHRAESQEPHHSPPTGHFRYAVAPYSALILNTLYGPYGYQASLLLGLFHTCYSFAVAMEHPDHRANSNLLTYASSWLAYTRIFPSLVERISHQYLTVLTCLAILILYSLH